MKIKAPSFADLFAETSPQLGGARRTKFLETLDRIIPWQDLRTLIGPYYSEGKRGAQPYPLELMIRIHFLQLVYNLSDPMCEETLHDSFACRRFVGLTIQNVPMRRRSYVSAIYLRKTVWTNKSLICLSSSSQPEVFSSAKARLLTALLLKRRVRRKTLAKSEILKCIQRRKAATGTSE